MNTPNKNEPKLSLTQWLKSLVLPPREPSTAATKSAAPSASSGQSWNKTLKAPSIALCTTSIVGAAESGRNALSSLTTQEKSKLLTESLADQAAADRAVKDLLKSCCPGLAKKRAWFAAVDFFQSGVIPGSMWLLTDGPNSARWGVVSLIASTVIFSRLNTARSKTTELLRNHIYSEQLSISTGQANKLTYQDRTEEALRNQLNQLKSSRWEVAEFCNLSYKRIDARLSAIGAFGAMALWSPYNFGAALLVCAGAGITLLFERKKTELNKKFQVDLGEPSAKVFTPADSFSNSETADQMCTMGQHQYPENYMRRETGELTRIAKTFTENVYKLVNYGWMINAGVCVTAGAGLLWCCAAGVVEIGSVVLFAGGVVGLQASLSSLVEIYGSRERAAVGANRTLGLADHWRKVTGEQPSFSAEQVAQWRERLRKEGFGFQLENITVEKGEGEARETILRIKDRIVIAPGELVGIVGESGSGKTTFMRVLLGIEKPTQGEVIVIVGSDLVPLSEIPLEALHGEIGYAPQDGYDGNGLPVKEFLGLGANENDEFREMEMAEAIKEAEADFLQNKLSGRIGTGWRPSGGERVRMRIVQSRLGNRPMNVLDEPLTGLDNGTKHNIVTKIQGLKGEKTQLYITHDFSGLGEADKLIVIQKGYPVVFGTPEELRNQKGHYRDLLEMHYSSLPKRPDKIDS